MTDAQPVPGPTGDAPPVCYRHPGRETYIRCARCDKPICPECMVSAAVGFQCPDCVAEGRRTQRKPKTVFGGEVRAKPDVVTIGIIAACVAVFAVQVAYPAFTPKFWMRGIDVADGQWYRLITCGFLHVSVLHIAFNMWALWVVGRPMEQLLGRARFSALYFVSLLAGSTASYLFSDPQVPALGASGAIFGLFGGMLVVARRMRWNMNALVAIVAVNLALPFVMPGIDWHAHVGGLVAGAAATAAMAFSPQRWRGLASAVACVALVLVCVALVPVRSQQITSDPRYSPALDNPQTSFRPSVQ